MKSNSELSSHSSSLLLLFEYTDSSGSLERNSGALFGLFGFNQTVRIEKHGLVCEMH